MVQYSPKIMHAQEVVQEVLAPQEQAGSEKLNCALSTVPNARSSKSYLQEASSPTANTPNTIKSVKLQLHE